MQAIHCTILRCGKCLNAPKLRFLHLGIRNGLGEASLFKGVRSQNPGARRSWDHATRYTKEELVSVVTISVTRVTAPDSVQH
jgi:hypothetical protein